MKREKYVCFSQEPYVGRAKAKTSKRKNIKKISQKFNVLYEKIITTLFYCYPQREIDIQECVKHSNCV